MIIYTEKFCTNLELKEFAFNANTSLHNLKEFLESKTLGKYTVVDKAFLQELYQLIDYSNNFGSKITHQLNNSWIELVKNNDQVKVKWSEHITMFGL
jgi:hypothetical protein